MNTFVMHVLAAGQERHINGITSFVGEDASGLFGIQAYHARFMTTLIFGLARFRLASESWQYVALPGAVLYFNHNELTLSTRHFLIDSDLERISALLQQQFAGQEDDLRATRESLDRMEHAMLKRLMSLKRKTVWQS